MSNHIQIELTGGPQFILTLADDPAEPGKLLVEGLQIPQDFNPNSPAHIVSWFLSRHLDQTVAVAKAEFEREQRLHSKADDAKPIVLQPNL